MEPAVWQVTCEAAAKVNLTLEILGKRQDGYHEIRSVFRQLALHDVVRLAHAPTIEVCCSDSALAGTANLAHRAAHLLAQVTGYQGGARIAIEKHIPVAAGLGGGSSDAAATLQGLCRLWHKAVPAPRLRHLAAELGADVPFFLLGGTAIGSGKGDLLTPLASPATCPVLLVKPPIVVSTAAVYAMVTGDAYSSGEVTARFAAMPPETAPRSWPLTNALQPFTTQAFPVVAEVLRALRDWGALQALMCGSGPTCFGLFSATDSAERAAREARRSGWSAWVTAFAAA